MALTVELPDDGACRLWESKPTAEVDGLLTTFRTADGARVLVAAFAASGDAFAAADAGGRLYAAWPTRNRAVAFARLDGGAAVTALALTPAELEDQDGMVAAGSSAALLLAAGLSDGRLELWRAQPPPPRGGAGGDGAARVALLRTLEPGGGVAVHTLCASASPAASGAAALVGCTTRLAFSLSLPLARGAGAQLARLDETAVARAHGALVDACALPEGVALSLIHI